MSRLLIRPEAIAHKYLLLNNLFNESRIRWSAATKVLSGYKPLIELLADLGVRSFSDSRLANLRSIKYLCPNANTIYIRPLTPFTPST